MESKRRESELWCHLKKKYFYDASTGRFYNKNTMNRVGHIANGYERINILGQTIQTARLVYLMEAGVLPTKRIKRINGNSLDNTWKNIMYTQISKYYLELTFKYDGCLQETPKGAEHGCFVINDKFIMIANNVYPISLLDHIKPQQEAHHEDPT